MSLGGGCIGGFGTGATPPNSISLQERGPVELKV